MRSFATTPVEEPTPTTFFENTVLDTRNLPCLDPDTFEALPPRFQRFRLWSLGIAALVLSAAWMGPLLMSFAALEDSDPEDLRMLAVLFGSIWALLFGVWFLEEFKGFPLRGYVLRDKDLTYRAGWIFRKVTTIPFNRIQHSEISQGPLGRLFRLNRLKIYTAGGSASDLSIPGLDPEVAVRLRDFVNGQAQDHA